MLKKTKKRKKKNKKTKTKEIASKLWHIPLNVFFFSKNIIRFIFLVVVVDVVVSETGVK